MIIVRTLKQLRYRDIKRILMSRHEKNVKREILFIRLRISQRSSKKNT